MSAAWIILGLVTLAGRWAHDPAQPGPWVVVPDGEFLGLAGLYLALSATFVALTQVLVYLGAVSILIVFAILLTRGGATLESSLTGTGVVDGGDRDGDAGPGRVGGCGDLGPRQAPAEAASEPRCARSASV
jgi:hypothetical protein